MTSLATATATRRPKWHYSQPAPPTPRILHFPRRPRTRRRATKSHSDKPSYRLDHKGKLESLFEQERTFSRESVPVVLLEYDGQSSRRRERVEERESDSVVVGTAEEKWRFQAEMLRAECNLLRMEREVTNKKLERTLRSAVQALVSGRNKIYEGKDLKMVLEEEINDLAQKLERLRKCSRVKDTELKKCSNFDKRVSLLKKKLEKIGEGANEATVTGMRETTEVTLLTKETCIDPESFILSGKLNVDTLKKKMEELSKGTLLERMREECRPMLSTVSGSIASSASSSNRSTEFHDFSRSKQLPNQDSISQEENLCSGHCKVIIRSIVEQVQAEKDQWSQMQEMLSQVREEMEELQVSREFWKDRALDSEYQIQSLNSSVEEWRQKAINYEKELQEQMAVLPKELERLKKEQASNLGRVSCLPSPSTADAPDEMEKHVLICRVKENHHHAHDVRSRRREISIDEQRKNHSETKGLEKSERLPFRDIGNSSSLIRKKLGINLQIARQPTKTCYG